MRTIKIAKSLSDNTSAGGYICRTISNKFINSSKISVATHFYHKPYRNDWGKAREKAYEGGLIHG